MFFRVVWVDLPEVATGPVAADLRALAAGRSADRATWLSAVSANRPLLYRALSPGDLQAIRANLHRYGVRAATKEWMEVILRFCEVNSWRHERCMIDHWGRWAAPSLTVLTTACLLEAGLLTEDLRFLNIVLKLRKGRFFPSSARSATSTNKVLALANAINEITTSRVQVCRHH